MVQEDREVSFSRTVLGEVTPAAAWFQAAATVGKMAARDVGEAQVEEAGRLV